MPLEQSCFLKDCNCLSSSTSSTLVRILQLKSTEVYFTILLHSLINLFVGAVAYLLADRLLAEPRS